MQVQGSQKVYTGVWQVSVSLIRCATFQPYLRLPPQSQVFKSAQGLVYMAKNEGLRGMFRGNWTNCVRIVPNSAVKFLTYEQLIRCV